MIHVAASWAMVGLIWTIQVVHYPMLLDVGEAAFRRCHDRHMARILWLVGPLMLAEAASATGLLYWGERTIGFLLSLGLLAVAWGCTALVQVPLHQQLEAGYDPGLIRRLVRTNSWRTAAWTLRGGCLLAVVIPRL
jgi:hypothetical protein